MASKQTTQREVLIYGSGLELVEQVKPSAVNPGCAPGRHCCSHGSGPTYPCCKCGATFKPKSQP